MITFKNYLTRKLITKLCTFNGWRAAGCFAYLVFCISLPGLAIFTYTQAFYDMPLVLSLLIPILPIISIIGMTFLLVDIENHINYYGESVLLKYANKRYIDNLSKNELRFNLEKDFGEIKFTDEWIAEYYAKRVSGLSI